MTNEALIDSFQALETQLGLRKMGTAPLVFEIETHRVSIGLGDFRSTVTCGVVLKALPSAWVDDYSIISFYRSEALEAFLQGPQKRTDKVIADFIARELADPCAAVFEITDTSTWMRLHQHFLQSMRRRNDVFGTRVSGLDEGDNMFGQATY